MIAPYMPCKNRRGRPRVTAMRAGEFNLFHRSERLPVAVVTEGVSALYDGATVLLPVAR
jgi:hypothetical protein